MKYLKIITGNNQSPHFTIKSSRYQRMTNHCKVITTRQAKQSALNMTNLS